MLQNSKVLIVGSDGLVGASLFSSLVQIGVLVTPTTRRQICTDDIEYFDLLIHEPDSLLKFKPDIVFITAAVTNISFCEQHPDLSSRINVTSTVELAKVMLSYGAFVIFISSNTVFNGCIFNVSEDHPYCPTVRYGYQKAAAEQQLLALPNANTNLTIVRLSKIVTPKAGIAAEFLSLIQDGKYVEPFYDLMFCPASISFVVKGLITIALSRKPGIFHLSGEEEMSYAQFALSLTHAIGADSTLVKPITTTLKGIDVLFRPRHPALGMERTKNIFGIYPESSIQMINELVGSNQLCKSIK